MQLQSFFPQDDAGNLLTGGTATVYLKGTQTLATGLADAVGNPVANPVPAAESGRIQFRAPMGDYDVLLEAAGRALRVEASFAEAGDLVMRQELADPDMGVAMVGNLKESLEDIEMVTKGPNINVADIQAALRSSRTTKIIPTSEEVNGQITMPWASIIVGENFRGQPLQMASEAEGDFFIKAGDGCAIKTFGIRGPGKEFDQIGIDVSLEANTSKWFRGDNLFIQHFGIGIALGNYYHNLTGIISHQNKVGIQVGNGVNSSGAVNISGAHIRNNTEAGIFANGSNQVWVFGSTFEFNKVHLKNYRSTLSVVGAYLADPPVHCIENDGGSTSVDLIGADQMVSGSSFDFLEPGEDPFVNYPVFCIKNVNGGRTIIRNGTIGVMNQIRNRPGGGTGSILGAVISKGGTVELENVTMYIGTGAANGSIRPVELSESQIIVKKHPIKNYVCNGTFLDESGISPEFLTSGNSVAEGLVNPWGGAMVRSTGSGLTIKYKVPQHMVGKDMLLMVLAGENEGSNAVGVRYSESDLTISSEYPALKKISSEGADMAHLFAGRKSPEGDIYAGCTRLVVRPTMQEGVVRIIKNVAGAYNLAGIILTEITRDTSYPFGWFEDDGPLALETGDE